MRERKGERDAHRGQAASRRVRQAWCVPPGTARPLSGFRLFVESDVTECSVFRSRGLD